MNNKTPNKRKSLAGNNDTPRKIQRVVISPLLRNKATGNNSPKTPNTKSPIWTNNDIAELENDEENNESEDENVAAEEELEGDDEVKVENEVDVESEDENVAAEEQQNDHDEVEIENEVDVESEDENIHTDEEQDDNVLVESNDNASKKNKESRNRNCAFVMGIQMTAKLFYLFDDCTIKTCEPQITEYGKLLGHIVHFQTAKCLINAIAKNGTIYDNRGILVENFYSDEHEYFNVLVDGLSLNSNMKKVFMGCKVEKMKKHKKITNAYLIKFADEKSVQKALLKDKTEYEDRILTVSRLNCSVTVTGLESNRQVINFFRDVKGTANIDTASSVIRVSFTDRNSLEVALSLNGTEYEGETIIVTENLPSCTNVKPFTIQPFNNPPYNSEPISKPHENRTKSSELSNTMQLIRVLQSRVLMLQKKVESQV